MGVLERELLMNDFPFKHQTVALWDYFLMKNTCQIELNPTYNGTCVHQLSLLTYCSLLSRTIVHDICKCIAFRIDMYITHFFVEVGHLHLKGICYWKSHPQWSQLLETDCSLHVAAVTAVNFCGDHKNSNCGSF